MAEPKLLFVVGCPRSGTTWLQVLCAEHPGATTGRETHLFTRYLAKLVAAFQQETRELHNMDGLAAFFSEEAFADELLRPFAERVIGALRSEAPDAALVIEKTPSHILSVTLIGRLFPDSYMLHIIRDPRSVVASWKAAAREKWGAWARKTTEEVAKVWVTHVGKRVEARAALGERYRELFYEDLVADVGGVMIATLDWIGLDRPPQLIDRMGEFTVAALRGDDAGLIGSALTDTARRPNFVRRGNTESWREELDPEDLKTIKRVCGPLLAELGHAAYMS